MNEVTLCLCNSVVQENLDILLVYAFDCKLSEIDLVLTEIVDNYISTNKHSKGVEAFT